MLRWVTDWRRRASPADKADARRRDCYFDDGSTGCGSERNVFMATTRLETPIMHRETPVSSQSKSSVK